MMRKENILFIALTLCAALTMGSCSEDTTGDYQPSDRGLAVTFDTYIGTRAGATGALNDITALRESGFGVFSFYTQNNTWEDNQSTLAPNFMYNQQVSWTDTDNDGLDDSWTYSPLKYWPNDNNPADDGTAAGSQPHSYLSFFAYAPYTAAEPSSGTVLGEDGSVLSSSAAVTEKGIVSLTSNTTQSAPKITYRWSADLDNQVDLLYAQPQTNLYKTKDTHEGYTNGNVLFTFKHALTCINFTVQRVYDDENNPNSLVGGSSAAASDTRIFVSSLQLTPTAAMPTSGTFNLATATWESTANTGGDATISISADNINNDISGTLSDDADDIKTKELNKYATGLLGVTETAVPLLNSNRTVMVMPGDNASFDIDITYSFITKDNELALSNLTDYQGNKYGRIVNRVSKPAVEIGDLQPGKKYDVLIKIGVEEVTFEVIGVEDWYFPMRFTPSTSDYSDGGESELIGNEQ